MSFWSRMSRVLQAQATRGTGFSGAVAGGASVGELAAGEGEAISDWAEPLLPPPSGDEAVGTREEDRLGRAPLAEAIAAQIAAVDPESGVVFGLAGPWGSGKTSLLRMTREALQEDHEGFAVLWFNPWLFTGSEQVVGVFFTELGAQLSDLPGAGWDESSAAMRDFGATLSKLRDAPATTSGGFFGRASGEGGSLHRRRIRLEDALRKVVESDGRRLVVIVDDLDRLRPHEIRDFAALVKMNADLPNLNFVLAYDRERVERIIGEVEGYGQAYLEKVVQVVHDVPKGRGVDLTQRLVDAMNEAVAGADSIGPFDERRFESLLRGVISPLANSARDVRRYADSLPVTLRVVGDEAALEDVLALEAIRVFLPEAFTALANSANALTTPRDQLGAFAPSDGPQADDSQADNPQAEVARAEVESFIRSGGEKEGILREARRRLFPASLWTEGDRSGSEWQKYWSRRRLAAHPRVLGLYLEKRLPRDVLPASEADELFESFGDADRLGGILGAMDSETLERTLERLLDYEDDYRLGDAESAVPVLLNQLPRLRDRANGFTDLGADIKMERVVLKLLQKVADPTSIAALVKSVAPRIESLTAHATLVEMVGRGKGAGHKLVGEGEASDLEAQLLAAMEETPTRDFARERDPVGLLYLAVRIDPKRGGEFVRRLTERDEVFLAVARKLRREIRLAAAGALASRVAEEFGWTTLCDLFGEEDARRRVNQLVRAADSGAMDGQLDDESLAALRVAQEYAAGSRSPAGRSESRAGGAEPDDLGPAPRKA